MLRPARPPASIKRAAVVDPGLVPPAVAVDVEALAADTAAAAPPMAPGRRASAGEVTEPFGIGVNLMGRILARSCRRSEGGSSAPSCCPARRAGPAMRLLSLTRHD